MPPSYLEFTKMNVDNISENVVPQSASAKFNVRFNSTYKSTILKKKLSKIINAVAKKENCKTKIDYKFGMKRTEYHCAKCGARHGHVFNDGPTKSGKRFCNNGLCLLFIPET